MSVRIWLLAIAFSCVVAGLVVAGGRQTQPRNAEHAAHLRAAKNAARFDWTGVLARNCIVPEVGPAACPV